MTRSEAADTTSGQAATYDINELQRRVGQWHQRNFPDATEPQRALIICEEAGELAHVVLKQSQGIRPESATDEMLADAMGDIIIATLAFAAHRGWDIGVILHTTAETVLARDWTKKP